MIYSKKLKKYNGLSHCFFNRTGGLSKGIFKSLNCGKGSLDNEQNVKNNINQHKQDEVRLHRAHVHRRWRRRRPYG